MNTNVTELLQPQVKCNEIVSQLIKIRKDANFSQDFIASWLGVSRKKINEFENGNFDFDLMLKYADKLTVTINITYEIN